MANERHVGGPTRSLPGRKFKPEQGACCDDHDDVLAVVKIQGETDSYGCEYFYLCQDCLTEWEAPKEPVKECCEWCKTSAVLSPIRDSGEGVCGPVYYVCTSCAKQNIRNAISED